MYAPTTAHIIQYKALLYFELSETLVEIAANINFQYKVET